ncbi:hypothetical protein PG994_010192 [Apiospora phragmitis]|uniref:J domain-containing protein n=1 Tax=Apiospora phragmitis TaxID=2905665 RepID=A0ABR1TPF1_9PEZI
MPARRANDEKEHTGPSFMPSSALSNVLDTRSKPSLEEDVQSEHEDDPKQQEGPNTHPDPGKKQETPPKMSLEGTKQGRLEEPKPDTGSGRKSLDDADQDFRSAVQEVAELEVSNARLRYHHVDLVKAKNEITNSKLDQAVRDLAFKQVLDELKGRKTGSDLTEEEIHQRTEEIKSRGDAIMDAIAESVMKAVENDAKNDESSYIPQSQSHAKSRVLRLLRQNASYYELLGVKRDAKERDILKARNQWNLRLHPDRNKDDQEALLCTQVINGAADALRDARKRSEHDAFLKNKPLDPLAPGEEFAPNADDSDDGSDLGDEPDSEEEDEGSYPPPPRAVQRLHWNMNSLIQKLFSRLDGNLDAPVWEKEVLRHNNKIEENNKEHNRKPDMFTVPFHKLLACTFHQRSIIEYYKTGTTSPDLVQIRLQSLQDYFEGARRRGLYQWPDAWTALLMKPLRKKLGELKLPEEQMKTEPTPGKTPATPQNKERPPAPKPSQATGAPGGSGADRMDGVKHTGTELMTRPTPNDSKEIRELAYSSPPNGKFSSGFKLFIEVEGPNRLKVKTMRDVDLEDIYRCVKSDLPNVQTRRVNELHPDDLLEVKGVAWTDDRRYWTYVWAKRRSSDDEPIMTRTDFRKWQPNADWLIDQFIWDAGLIPTWAPEVLNSPFNPHSGALHYPKPSRKDSALAHNQMVLRQPRIGGHNDEQNYHHFGNGLASSAVGHHSPEITQLAQMLNALSVTVNTMQEQQRIQSDILRQFLPAP